MQTEIFLARHGESFSNVQRRFVSTPPGPGLTNKGIVQAEAAARLIFAAAPHLSCIYASPLRRAVATAEPLTEKTGLVPEICHGLAETAFGAWDGRTVEDLAGLSQFDGWCENPDAFPPPGGESLGQVATRTLETLRRLADAHPRQTIAAFSHMHPLVCFLRALEDQPYGDIEWLPNATIIRGRWDGRTLRFVDLDLRAAQADGAPGRAVG